MKQTVLFLLIALVAAVHADARSAGAVSVTPEPRWVAPITVDYSVTPPTKNVRLGVHYLLVDDQVRVTPAGETTRYSRRVERILSTAGVQNASEIKIDFDPSHERLAMHFVRIRRAGSTIDSLDAASIKVIQRESELDQQIYDGTLTALLFLEDVRPGDVIDLAWSTSGTNPLLKNRIVDEFDMAFSLPIHFIRQRLVAPSSRKLSIRSRGFSMQPAITTTGGETTYLWERRNVDAIGDDGATPAWFDNYPTVQISEFASWGEVATWGRETFDVDTRLTPGMKELTSRWTREHTTAEARALAAVRFVQDDVRYLGIELGSNSHRPHKPAEVFAQRFGDCKDKSLLLVTLLKEMGIAAYPALTNSSFGRVLADWLPSPFAFDHAIVLIELGAARVWVDPTLSHQGGTLAAMTPAPFERALVLREGTNGLTSIASPLPARPLVTVREEYDASSMDAPAALSVTTTYRGEEADRMRAALADQAPEDLAKSAINSYAHEYPKIAATAAPVVADDRARNEIIVREKYSIPELWDGKYRAFSAWAIEERLTTPRTALRSMPLGLDHPVAVEQLILVKLPAKLKPAATKESVVDEAFRFTSSSEVRDRTLILRYQFTSLRDSVDAARVGEHFSQVRKIRDALTFSADFNAVVPATEEKKPAMKEVEDLVFNMVFAAIALVVLIFTVTRLRRSFRRAGFRRMEAFRPGEAPSSAVRVQTISDLEDQLNRFRCSCGSTLVGSEADLQNIRYQESCMTLVTRACTDCNEVQSLYFDVLETNGTNVVVFPSSKSSH